MNKTNNTQNHTGKANDMVSIEELARNVAYIARDNFKASSEVIEALENLLNNTLKQAIKDTEERERKRFEKAIEKMIDWSYKNGNFDIRGWDWRETIEPTFTKEDLSDKE